MYGTDQGFADYLAIYGHTLPNDAPSPTILRARGSSYIDSTYEAHLTGRRAGGVLQADAWPRTGAKLNCLTSIPDDAIPVTVVNAAYRAAWLEASTPGVLAASFTAGQRVRRSKVDVIEEEYFDDGGTKAGSGGPAFIDAEIDGAMRAFICANTSSFFFETLGS